MEKKIDRRWGIWQTLIMTLKLEDNPFNIKTHDLEDIIEYIMKSNFENSEEDSPSEYLTNIITDLTFIRDSYDLESQDD